MLASHSTCNLADGWCDANDSSALLVGVNLPLKIPLTSMQILKWAGA